MKKSEEFAFAGQREENDLKAMNFHRKSIREKRIENFLENQLEKLNEKFEVIEEKNNGKFVILKTHFGNIDFFPKSNRILIRANNNWKNNGSNWIQKNLLK